jgi:HK97 family phage prohead protease
MTRVAKHFSAPVSKLLDTQGVGARQVLAVISDPTLDRTKDVMPPEGCVLDNYRENNIVLANHDPTHPIGNANVTVRNNRVEALIDFAKAGVSEIADTWCGLAKAGVLRAFSVGFNPIEYKPNKSGGYDYDRWELMEVSLVAIPANPGARIIARAFDAARMKRERADVLVALDQLDVGAIAKPAAPARELRGGPWLTKWVREQEAARLRAFWNAPLR